MTTFRAGLLAALLAGAPAAAQPEPRIDGDDIVVTGERPTHREVSRQARDITDIGSDVRDRPLARIADRLCPGVIGLKRSAAELMIDRIRWNAEQLDMWMADDTDCRPNLIIAFVEDGKGEIAGLRDAEHR
jgi:hypothetical protein